MKLSDIRGERTMDVIADIIEPIANIAEDPAAVELFKKAQLEKGADANKFLMDRVKRCVPALLKGHKADVIAVFAAIEGVTTEEYAASLNLVKLTNDCMDLLTDEAFLAFFTSTGAPFGDVSENTGGLSE